MTKSKTSQGATRLSDAELDKKIEATRRLSVLPVSNDRYAMKIWSMKKWLRDRYGPDKVVMERVDFARFLEDGKDGKGIRNPNSAKTWRSAYNFWCEVEGMTVKEDPQEDARVKRQLAGLKYVGGTGTVRQPDTIDSGRRAT